MPFRIIIHPPHLLLLHHPSTPRRTLSLTISLTVRDTRHSLAVSRSTLEAMLAELSGCRFENIHEMISHRVRWDGEL